MPQKKVSDAAVKKATGKIWKEWNQYLDESNARDLPHKEIVEELI